MTLWTSLAKAAAHTTNTVLTGYHKTCEWEERAAAAITRGEMKMTGGRTLDEVCSDTGDSMSTAYTAVRSGTPVATPTTTLLAQATRVPRTSKGMVLQARRPYTDMPILGKEYTKAEVAAIEAEPMETEEELRDMEALEEMDNAFNHMEDTIASCASVLAWMTLNPTTGPEVELIPVKVSIEAPTPKPLPKARKRAGWRVSKPSIGNRILDLVCPLNKDVITSSIIDLKGGN